MAVQRARLCIVSREPFRSPDFAAALYWALSREDNLEVVVDRRHSESSAPSGVNEERRRRPEVDAELRAKGFVIVPAGESTEPIDRFEVDGEEQEALEEVGSFLHQWRDTLLPRLVGVLGGATVVALAVLLAGHLNAPPDPGNATLLPAPARIDEAVVRAISPARPDSPPPSAAGATRTRSDSPRDADRITPTSREISDPPGVSAPVQEASIASRPTSPPPTEVSPAPRKANAPADEVATPPRTARNKGARDTRPEQGATARATPSDLPGPDQIAAVSPPAKTASAEPAPVESAHRAQLVGQPSSRGWGNSYAVRLLDGAGRPVVDASVHLVASMADGSVEKVAMGALGEPGTYRGTVPTNRSTPVNVRVHVSSGGGFVELPVRQ